MNKLTIAELPRKIQLSYFNGVGEWRYGSTRFITSEVKRDEYLGCAPRCFTHDKVVINFYIGKKDTRLEVLTAVLLKTPVFRNVTPCRSENMYERFEGLFCCHLKGTGLQTQNMG
jgi:hypothetical protein